VTFHISAKNAKKQFLSTQYKTEGCL